LEQKKFDLFFELIKSNSVSFLMVGVRTILKTRSCAFEQFKNRLVYFPLGEKINIDGFDAFCEDGAST
jgi:hypothetical protein